MTKIGYNIKANTARQQMIIDDIKSSAYYNCSFSNVVMDLQEKVDQLHPETISYDIDHHTIIQGETVHHSIVYKFNNLGQFKKKEIKKYIYNTYDKVLYERKFHLKNHNFT